ncbi:DUF3592 domain-containing protein [Marinobacter sp. CHS3-4]|uniref:DUF3592 domain-containing protein n=1 Tax=Marinobacter sp. CHS3-4 TaxID=3045174 RepID=UPI0024B5BC69|nr:DUF3592 domain-containing protein [Marinobacter sp. CHS3-4]MDI9244036.1 DUF3592 domain-containing protein [Marinobacter sp. CHS3-4]
MKLIESNSDFLVVSIGLVAVVTVAGLFAIALPDLAHHLLLIISGTLILAGGLKVKHYSEKKNWIQSKAVLRSVEESQKGIMESQYGPKRRYLYPEVKYEYSHHGQNYMNTVVADSIKDVWVPEINAFGDKTPDAKKIWQDWVCGSEVPVYINPQDPHQSVLISRPSKKRKSHLFALIVSGLLVFLVWAAIVVTT